MTRTGGGTAQSIAKDDRAMKGLIFLIGVLVIVVLLVSSGVLGGAVCLNDLGCLHTDGNGISIDNQETVTITTGNP